MKKILQSLLSCAVITSSFFVTSCQGTEYISKFSGGYIGEALEYTFSSTTDDQESPFAILPGDETHSIFTQLKYNGKNQFSLDCSNVKEEGETGDQYWSGICTSNPNYKGIKIDRDAYKANGKIQGKHLVYYEAGIDSLAELFSVKPFQDNDFVYDFSTTTIIRDIKQVSFYLGYNNDDSLSLLTKQNLYIKNQFVNRTKELLMYDNGLNFKIEDFIKIISNKFTDIEFNFNEGVLEMKPIIDPNIPEEDEGNVIPATKETNLGMIKSFIENVLSDIDITFNGDELSDPIEFGDNKILTAIKFIEDQNNS